METAVMSSGTPSTPVLVDREAEILSRVEYRLMESDAAREEMSHCVEFDYVIVNENFAVAVDEIRATETVPS